MFCADKLCCIDSATVFTTPSGSLHTSINISDISYYILGRPPAIRSALFIIWFPVLSSGMRVKMNRKFSLSPQINRYSAAVLCLADSDLLHDVFLQLFPVADNAHQLSRPG